MQLDRFRIAAGAQFDSLVHQGQALVGFTIGHQGIAQVGQCVGILGFDCFSFGSGQLASELGLGLGGQVFQALVARCVGTGAQGAFFVAFVDDFQRFSWIAGLQCQLAHFHVFGRLAQQAIGQAQAQYVERQRGRVARLGLYALQQVGPGLWLRIARCHAFQGLHVTGLVVLLELDVGQHAQLGFVQVLLRRQFLGCFSVLAADVVGLDQQFFHGAVVRIVLECAVDPGDRFWVVLDAVVDTGQGLGEFRLFGSGQLAGIDHAFEGFGGRVVIACGRRGGGARAFDQVRVVGGFVTDRVGFAQFCECFLVFSCRSQFLCFLQWFADFSTHCFGREGNRRKTCQGSCCSKTNSGHYQAEMSETKLGHG